MDGSFALDLGDGKDHPCPDYHQYDAENGYHSPHDW
jgi:hypothetical protein